MYRRLAVSYGHGGCGLNVDASWLRCCPGARLAGDGVRGLTVQVETGLQVNC